MIFLGGLTLLYECDNIWIKVNNARNYITLLKFKCLYFIIKISWAMWPWSSISTYHIGTMTYFIILKQILIVFYNILMRNAYSNPISCRKSNLKSQNGRFRSITTISYKRLHQCHLINPIFLSSNGYRII